MNWPRSAAASRVQPDELVGRGDGDLLGAGQLAKLAIASVHGSLSLMEMRMSTATGNDTSHIVAKSGLGNLPDQVQKTGRLAGGKGVSCLGRDIA